MTYTTKEKIDLLQKNKRIYNTVIKECIKKLPIYKMTYPKSVEINFNGTPNYFGTKQRLRKVIKSIDIKLREMKNA